MAEFQYPDILGSYVRGRMAPGELQAQQQGLQEGGLRLDQMRLMLGNQQMYQDVAKQALQGQGYLGGQGSQSAGAQSTSMPTGGIQNGPQGAVGAETAPQGVMGFTPSTLGALALLRGDDPLKTAQGVQEYQKTQMQLQAQGPLNLAESVMSDPNADQIVRNNPSLQQAWINSAKAMGLDPFRDLTPENARRAATFSYNQIAGMAGLPAKPMPSSKETITGAYGQILQRDPMTGALTNVVDQKLPTYATEKGYDVSTGHNVAKIVQTSPGGYAPPIGGGTKLPQGSNPGGMGDTIRSGIDLGYSPPTTENIKQVGFAATMRDGLQTMRSMEDKGVALTPTQRAQVIDVATTENVGTIHQLLSQEGLKHGLSHDAQTYLAAMMPVIQAVSHDQSGARLNASQIRTNLESVIPVDVKNKDALSMINKTRDNFQNAMNLGAGSAAFTPAFKNSVGASQEALNAPPITKSLGGKTYEKRGGKWYEK